MILTVTNKKNPEEDGALEIQRSKQIWASGLILLLTRYALAMLPGE